MAKLLKVPMYSDERGDLIVIEKCLPFNIKRVFFIKNVPPNLKRGEHGHKKNKTALIAVNGSCSIYYDDGSNQKDIILNCPSKCLLLEPNDWHVLYDFKDDCVLLALASEEYNIDDYVYNI